MASRKIAKLVSLDGLNILRATCGCMSEDHNQDIMFNVEKDDDFIYASIEVNLAHITDTYDDNFLVAAWKRVKMACSILFTGRLQLSHQFYFEDAEQVKDYADAVVEAFKESQEFRDKRK